LKTWDFIPGFFAFWRNFMELTKVNKEYKRLKSLFKEVDENKTKLVDELLQRASFLKVQLKDLEDDISKSGVIQKSNKGNVRMNPAYKIYLNSVAIYQSIIKTLNQIMGQNVIDGEDEFDEFIKNANL